MRKTLGTFFALSLLLCVLMAIGAPATVSADTLRIGAILALTGNSAANGQSMRDGLLLAVEEINKRGGVNGSKIDLAIADDKSDPQAAVDALNTMEATHPPLFYVSMLSSIGVALAPLADSRKVVLVGLATSAAAFTEGHDMCYRDYPLARDEAQPLLRILGDLRVKKLGIIYSTEEYGTEIQRLLKKGFEDAGGTVATQPFALTDISVSRQVEALKGQEAVVVATLGAGLISAVRELKASNPHAVVLVPSSGAVPSYFALPEMDAVYVSAPIIYNPGYLYAREASEKFLARYKSPLTIYAANGYSFMSLVSGLLENSQLTRQAVKDAMAAGFQYSGVFGSVRLRAGEHDFSFTMYPAQILNGLLKYR